MRNACCNAPQRPGIVWGGVVGCNLLPSGRALYGLLCGFWACVHKLG